LHVHVPFLRRGINTTTFTSTPRHLHQHHDLYITTTTDYLLPPTVYQSEHIGDATTVAAGLVEGDLIEGFEVEVEY
jgi:hypothetical protein